jgi:hypothetical protein
MRLIQATTSWELGRDGLSRAITPELQSFVNWLKDAIGTKAKERLIT